MATNSVIYTTSYSVIPNPVPVMNTVDCLLGYGVAFMSGPGYVQLLRPRCHSKMRRELCCTLLLCSVKHFPKKTAVPKCAIHAPPEGSDPA